MDAATSLLSPRSCPSSAFSFSPLPSPSSSPSSSAFSFSPRPLTSPSPTSRRAAFPDLDTSSLWGLPRPFTTPLQQPPRRRSSAVHVSNYAATAETHPTTPPSASPSPWAASPPRTHYDLLGVSPSSPPAQIRSSYRKLALQHHPDVSPLHQLDVATQLFAEINEAYTVLSDPEKKACYDMKLTLESQAKASTPPASPLSHAYYQGVASPRKYTDASTGRVYPSMNSFYREWRKAHA